MRPGDPRLCPEGPKCVLGGRTELPEYSTGQKGSKRGRANSHENNYVNARSNTGPLNISVVSLTIGPVGPVLAEVKYPMAS